MKTLAVLVLPAVLVFASTSFADDPPLSQEQIEAQLMALGVPGEEHQRFQSMVGEWKTEMRMTIPGSEEPIVSEGTSTFELILDGRFLVQEFNGEFAGMPFNGFGISGYDRVQEKYVGTWVDSYGTGMMSMEGAYDPETGVMTEIGTFPILGGEMKMKLVTEWQSEDQFLFTMYALGEGDSETKQAEITYTRASE